MNGQELGSELVSREMLWAAINKSDAKIKNNTSIINHYQAQIRYVQYMVNIVWSKSPAGFRETKNIGTFYLFFNKNFIKLFNLISKKVYKN